MDTKGMSSEEIQGIYDSLAQIPQQVADRGLSTVASQGVAHGGLAANMVLGNPEVDVPAGYAPTVPAGSAGTAPYTYNRLAAPTVNTLKANLVAEGKQAVLNQRIREMTIAAQDEYNNAKKAYNEGLRERNRRAAAAAARARQGYGGGSAGGGGGTASGSVTTQNTGGATNQLVGGTELTWDHNAFYHTDANGNLLHDGKGNLVPKKGVWNEANKTYTVEGMGTFKWEARDKSYFANHPNENIRNNANGVWVKQ